MNEWSPGGNYSRPGTPNQSSRSFRTQWDESEKGTKPLIVNIRAVSDNRSRSFLQYSMEDVSKSSLSTSSKNNKSGSGVSDPRFKRVLSSGVQNDACVGTELKSGKPSFPPDKEGLKTKLPLWMNVADLIPNQPWCDSVESPETAKLNPAGCEPLQSENAVVSESSNFDQSQDHLKAVDKLSFSHDIIMKSFSKESLSECTINTRNTSLASEDLGDDISNDLSMFPTATRVKKVQNWIQDQKQKPGKKQSVITVIGQTQEQENLSSALREIDKRRKLVKELDKYAMCKKIIETDKEKEISDLVAKINCLSDAGQRVFAEKKSPRSKLTSQSSKPKDYVDIKYSELAESDRNENLVNHSNDVNPDSVSSACLSHKRSSTKKKSKKSHSVSEDPIKGKMQDFFSRVQYQWIFCVMVLLSATLFWFTFFSVQKGTYVSFDLFSPKPKPLTWYEKVFTWLWELFRPTSNYRRTGLWHHSY